MIQRADTRIPRKRTARARETPAMLAFDLLLRTASELDQQVAALLRPAAVTPAQYNVLRILRSSSGEGLPCGEVSRRLVRHDPDVTRLLDRLEALGFVARSRDTQDRRVVIARLTDAGSALLDSLGPAIDELHARQFAVLSKAESKTLGELLQRMRASYH
ncbi:MAG TPA: MarR family transcriptional regulator [Gemmatimonadaceae bacterium]|nr:MarR family transcriptional regulator [Gemmatimonadaceae bacterium]